MSRLLMILTFLWGAAASAQPKEEIIKSIYFGGGSYEVDEVQRRELSIWLDSIPNLLDKYEIELISHTDPIGGKRFNEWLSQMRSETVFQLLVDKFIPEKMIHVKDWSFQNLLYSNQTFEGMVMNRRVDVIVRPIVF